ncbi:MAG: hypothetical protein IJW06_04585 [Clostridia bacterium]|nr:hypothetical protein [Clostridia bacterium]
MWPESTAFVMTAALNRQRRYANNTTQTDKKFVLKPVAAILIRRNNGGSITGASLRYMGEYRNVNTHMAGAINKNSEEVDEKRLLSVAIYTAKEQRSAYTT